MQKSFSRTDRLEEQILQETADIIRSDLNDPRLGFVTLTAIKISKDLQHARIFYTTLEEEGKHNQYKTSQVALTSARGYIRSALARRLNLYQIPQLNFTYDESVERGAAITTLLQNIKNDLQKRPTNYEEENNDVKN